ncbi:MAG: DEAD/DEAH box helicase [Chloroflexi bacterium]|nr:DEAD/DEAH box helicase [Chloroflexota bacterium]
MSLENLLSSFQLDPDFMRQITVWRRLPARSAQYAAFPKSLDPRLPLALRERGIFLLYRHQARAVEAALRGEHVALVTPTASGKTLAYNLPALHMLLNEPKASALYLFPTKALAQDQLTELRDLIGILQSDLTAAAYDGDVPRGQRKRIREHARIILSNPDMLHTGILPHHPAWAQFFHGLRLVVIDEIHTYRGVFGAHVANLFRRLQRICAFYGSQPQYFMTSATIANPEQHARRLIGEPVTLIQENAAPAGEKHFLFYNPPLIDRELGLRRSSLLEAQRIGERLLDHDVQTIFFARSRLRMELLLTYLRDAIARKRGAAPTDDIRGYRGGYLPAERRAIESGLKSGRIRAVVATNALELGVDIGQLQAAVLTGFPGTIASVWQQAGRAGRRRDASLAIFVASASALDQYIVQHPEYFFERSPEHALINPDNLVILTNHIRCAAFELPFRVGERFGDVEFTEDVLALLAEEGEVQLAGDRWHWTDSAYPAAEVSLRTASPDPILIIIQEAEEQKSPEVIGQLERESAPKLLYEGAVYLHEGQTFRVEKLDWEAGHAFVAPVSVDYYTEASTVTEVKVLNVHQETRVGELLKGFGDIEVRSQAIGYRRVKRWTHETLGYGEIHLPEVILETAGCWLAFEKSLVQRLRDRNLWKSDPIDYGPNWVEQRELARARDGFRCTQCGAPERGHRQHDVHHIRPFRSFGYIPGVNNAHLEANRLENLRTLCRACHHRMEQGVRLRSGLAGLAYLLGKLAPLHLMCDPADLGAHVEAEAPHTGLPSIVLFDQAPAGIGLAERLYDLLIMLLEAAAEVVKGCPCAQGCPACVGPSPEGAMAMEWDVKELTRVLLEEALTKSR